MLRILILTLAVSLPGLAAADEAEFDIASDWYKAGGTVVFSGPEGTDDLYMAGETIRVAAPIGGSAHLAGRRIAVTEAVGAAVYAAGYDVEITAGVGEDASVFGYDIAIGGPVGGDLRAAGSEVTISGDIAGYALLTGELVTLDSAIGGDTVIAARDITFGDGAVVAGGLTIYAADPDEVEVPDRVAPADRVTIRQIEEFDRGRYDRFGPSMPSTGQVIGGFLIGVLITGLFIALVVQFAPESVRRWRATAAERPGRALVSGFLVASMLSGSVIVLVFTVIGVLLVPFVFFLTWLVLFFGYALGAYLIGTVVWAATGKPMPEAFPGQFGVAVLGAFLTALAWIVPVLGWFFAMGLTLIGVGALAAHLLPRNLLLHAPGGSGASG